MYQPSGLFLSGLRGYKRRCRDPRGATCCEVRTELELWCDVREEDCRRALEAASEGDCETNCPMAQPHRGGVLPDVSKQRSSYAV
jgi:hypothetical protein